MNDDPKEDYEDYNWRSNFTDEELAVMDAETELWDAAN